MPKMALSSRERLRELVGRPIEGKEGSPMVARILLVEDVALGMLLDCERNQDARNASAIFGHLLRAAELVGKVTGELVDRRERTEVHHGGVMVLGVPQLQEPRKGVLAAPREGQQVSPEVARIGTTLDVLEAELVENEAETPETAS